MNRRNRRFRSLDPLVILTILVGIGVVLTTTVQARSPDEVPEPLLSNLPEEKPRSWLSGIVDDIGSFISTSDDDYASAVGGNRPVVEEGLSWHLEAAPDEAAAANILEPEVRFGVTYHW
jgi:hypothetical protein